MKPDRGGRQEIRSRMAVEALGRVMSIRLRYGEPAERKALEGLLRRASLEWDNYRADLLAHPEAIDLPLSQLADRRVRVAEIDGRTVGFAVMLPVDGTLWEVDGLFVEPAYWRRGIGRALIADGLALAHRAGAVMIEVIANPRAEDFYAKCGFAVSGRDQTQFGPATRMRYIESEIAK
jgi:GNAT superfamily N-acetyltransferase